MATMATSHSLSVLTNASVKQPLNPVTGLSTTLHDRSSRFAGRVSGIYYDDYDAERRAEAEIFDPSNSGTLAKSIDTDAILQLSNLSDEEFYNKLLQLKNEQRKILQKCEDIYIEKHKGAIQPTYPSEVLQGSHRTSRRTDDVALSVDRSWSTTRELESGMEQTPTTPPYRTREGGITPPTTGTPPRESYMDSAGKPPTGRPPVPITAKSITSPVLTRPSSVPISRQQAWSVDDLRRTTIGLRRSFEDDDYIPDDTVSEPYRARDMSLAMSKIDDMWDNFSIDDYAPRRSRSRERPSSATAPSKVKVEDSWRHRLTIPEPFNMTVREGNKEKNKTKNQLAFEQKLLAKQEEEEEECKKTFKATPVPAHVYLPLYDEIMETGETRRRHIRQMSQELLKSQEKPFSFTRREEDKKIQQRLNNDFNIKDVKTEKPIDNEFKAKPAPKYIFDDTVNDKIMEEEEYRKIRMKMRSRELLKTASLPPSMEAREKMKEEQARQQKLKSKRKAQKSHPRQRPNHQVPNYDALYRQFQEELHRRKCQREGTVVRPFRIEAKKTNKDKIKRDIERDEEMLKENRWPYKSSRTRPRSLGHISHSLDSLPSKSTRSADYRTSQTRNRISQLTQREQREIEEERKRRVRDMRLRREITERVPKETLKETPEERRRKNRDAERTRMEDYERELDDMKDRINRRPLLFEQESQTNARKAAEKKFNATLRSVGLDEDFVHSRGSRSASIRDSYDDEYDDDFDDTYVKDQRAESPIEA